MVGAKKYAGVLQVVFVMLY